MPIDVKKPLLVIENISGYCPVQSEGSILGLPYYFRARHGEWTLDIAETLEEAIGGEWLSPGKILYHYEGDDKTHGYMSSEEVGAILVESALRIHHSFYTDRVRKRRERYYANDRSRVSSLHEPEPETTEEKG